jgi:hypothetical protein
MEGNLSPDETKQLKAFVAAQGLDWEELTEELPHLKAPQIVYQDKDRLKSKSLSLPKDRSNNKPVLVPLYAKIASAAAAAGLLLTISLWPDKSMPEINPVAELKPIEAHLTVDETTPRLVPRRTVQMATTPSVQSESKDYRAPQPKVESVAILSPLKSQSVSIPNDADDLLVSDLTLLRYRMETRQAFAYLPDALSYEKEMPSSLIGKGIYWMTEGRLCTLGDLLNAGLHLAKQEVVRATTEVAMTAYYHAEEQIEETREYWQEKYGE